MHNKRHPQKEKLIQHYTTQGLNDLMSKVLVECTILSNRKKNGSRVYISEKCKNVTGVTIEKITFCIYEFKTLG